MSCDLLRGDCNEVGNDVQATEARAVTAMGNCIFYTPRVVTDEILNNSAPRLSMESVCGDSRNQVQVEGGEVTKL